jgi:hypothetical protein
MEKTEVIRRPYEQTTWEEESGLLDFFAKVYAEVARFESTFDFNISPLPSPPKSVDGDGELLKNVGFVVIRRNSSLVGRDYCLYSVLKQRSLAGFIGVYADGVIETVRELQPMTEFRSGTAMLHDWLRALVKASCDKI